MRWLIRVYLLYFIFISTRADSSFPAKFNVEWDQLDQTGIEASMPLGNGLLAGSFWSNPEEGQISFYLASSSAWDENANLLKLTLINVTLSPNPFRDNSAFNQTLDLQTSSIYLTIGDAAAHLWIDALHPLLRFSVASLTNRQYSIQVSMTNLRPTVKPFDSTTMSWYCATRFTQVDVVPMRSEVPEFSFPSQALFWYHRNIQLQNDYFTYSMKNQGLASLISPELNPTFNNTFGGIVFPDSSVSSSSLLKVTSPTTLQSTGPADRWAFIVAVQIDKTETLSDWYLRLAKTVKESTASSWSRHTEYWSNFWNRSRIDLASEFVVSRQYTLHRWLQAIQSQGASFPVKFNGMLFVAQPDLDPDFRQWGPANWWQNARLAYWNMLPSGDGDVMQAIFRYYDQMLPLALGRSEVYWNETGAAYWPETQTIIGLSYNNNGYGCPGSRDQFYVGVPQSRWNRYNVNGGLDLSMMILDHYAYTQDMTILKKYLPIVEAVVQHYRLHWPNIDATTGKQILYPSQSLETWQCITYPPIESDCVTNPLPDVAGLHVIISRLLGLDSDLITPAKKSEYQNYQSKLPGVPVKGGIIMPGEKLPASTTNVENTELYSVHPYRMFTATKDVSS